MHDDEDVRLRAVALQNAGSILRARQKAEEELLRAQAALRESRERLQAALAAAGTGTFRWDMTTNALDWDENLGRLFGLPAGHTADSLEAFLALVHPDDRVRVREASERCQREGTDLDLEFRAVWPDGSVHWIHDKGRTVLDEEGRPVYMTGACMDITRRRRDEEVLQQNADRLRMTFNQAAVGIAIAGLDGRFVDLNDKFSSILGYPADELRQLTFLDLTYTEDVDITLDHVRRLRAGEIPDYAIEKRFVRKDGSAVWCLTTVTLLRDASGQPERYIGVIEDISTRKRTEQRLRESEEQLRTLASSIPQLAWMADPDGHIFWYNQQWYTYTGTTPDEMTGWGWQRVHDPAVLPRVVERWKASLHSGEPFEMEFPIRGADGQFRWFLTRVNPLRDATGRVVRWFGTNTDVHEVRRAQEALSEETRILERLNDTGTAIASQLDLEGLLQTVTDAATALTGAKFGAFFYTVTKESGEAFLLYTLSGAPREAFDKFGLPRNTAVFHPTFHGEGVVRSADITTDPRYGHMPPHHGMPRGHLPVRSYLAVPVTSRTGESIGGLFFGHPDPGVFTERAERLAVGIAAQAGIAMDNARLYDAAQKANAERAVLLESERAARNAAERLSAMKDEFLATLSHELRTPLNAILGWSQILRRTGSEDPAVRRAVDTIERNARVQTGLIEDLLDMSRIASGKVRLDIQPLLPISFVEAAIETVQPSADARNITLDRVFDDGTGLIAGDPNRLQQVIWNLLSNAIKFTPVGGRVEVRVTYVGEEAHIVISDNGIGIDAEFVGHVFERFRQADASTTRKHAGLGLGLSIVKSLVELHGGSVALASDGEGRGTTVTVSLPLMAPSARRRRRGQRRTPRPAARGVVPSLDLTGVRVLVVDDDPDAREIVGRILNDSGASVLTAASVDEAVGVATSEQPTLLLSDIGIPGADGFDLLRRLRSLETGRASLPAIALTAFARPEDRQRALAEGFAEHVAKPVEPGRLLTTIGQVLGLGRRRRRRPSATP